MARLIVFLVLFLAFSASTTETANFTSGTESSLISTGIRLPVSGTVEVRTELGELLCKKGELWLHTPTLAGDSEPRILIENYGQAKSVKASAGSYFANTEIVLAIKPTHQRCQGQYFVSTDKLHARIDRLAATQWRITWEDLSEAANNDFDDLYTYVNLTPINPHQIVEAISAKAAFADPPKYQLPWETKATRKVSQIPGVGHHQRVSAYDFSGRFAIHAPERGIVVWVNDNWGDGNCKDNSLRYKGNRIVIQTAPDTQVVLSHIAKGSAKVVLGQQVEKGQLLALSGNSGYSCAAHLHIEFQTACRTLAQNVATWEQVVRGTKPANRNYWSCPAKSPFSDGFWIGGVFYERLKKLVEYTNTP